MRISKMISAAAVLFVLMLCGTPAAQAEETKLAEHVLGNPKATVTVDEYVSLTCSHCAEFYTKTLPELKKRYVDTGKVKFILRDFPLDGVALKASTLARCLPADQFYPFVNVLYSNLMQWAGSKDPEKALLQYAGLAGLSEEKAKSCLADTKLMDAIVSSRTEATKKYDIKATPTFVINDGAEVLTGAQTQEAFTAVLDRLLAAKK